MNVLQYIIPSLAEGLTGVRKWDYMLFPCCFHVAVIAHSQEGRWKYRTEVLTTLWHTTGWGASLNQTHLYYFQLQKLS